MVMKAVLVKLTIQMEWDWLRIMFLQWVSLTFQAKIQKLEDTFLPPPDEEMRPRSIWEMRKPELEQVAQRELGFTAGRMQGETVRSLRDKIRFARRTAWERLHPEARLPVGLTRMRVQEVAEECMRRGIPTYEGYQRLTKAQMKDRIHRQVAEMLALGRERIDAGTESLPGPGCPSLDPDYADEIPWETVASISAASSAGPSGRPEHC